MNKTYTFSTLVGQSIEYSAGKDVIISKVVIPRIQRAYAQGRTTEKETKIRTNFINDIFDHLTKKTEMDLHFIYGAVKAYGQSLYKLELLDGQQRFTTLYLLHWYLLNRESDDVSIRKALNSFMYETRSTTTEFCDSLAKSSFEFKSDGALPSELIKKARWYYHRFDKDSSIRGMLVMLDAIHQKYNDIKASGLLSEIKNLQFYVLPLYGYDMAEDLYIKMNQRGLQLSPFDNFKADFTGAMTSVLTLKEKVPLSDKNLVTRRERISIHLDTKWIDLFWDPGKKDFDASYMRFFSRFFAYRYILDSGKTAKEIQEDKSLPINVFYTQTEEENNRNEYLGFEEYAEVLKEEKNHDYFLMIETVLNVLYNTSHLNVIQDSLTPIWEKEKKGNFFIDADVPFSQSLLVVFGAVCEFIIAFKDFDEDTFKKWMRVVWNVVENTNIDSLRAATGPLRNLSRVIKEIAEAMGQRSSFRYENHMYNGNLTFYKALSVVQPPFEQRAITEEILKARRIAEDEVWLDAFVKAEKHPFLKGSVGFFYDYSLSFNQFIHIRDLAMDMFDKDGITTDYREKHILIRAIISNLKTWDEKGIFNRYITENSESKKRLKLLLLGNDDIRLMFVNVLNQSNNATEIKRKLNEVIASNRIPSYDGLPDEDVRVAITHNVLGDDVKLYDWMATQSSPVCVSWYNGHIAVAMPRVWYDRFIIDSERDQMAVSLINGLMMHYYDDGNNHATQADFDKFGRYKGLNLILKKSLQKNFSFQIKFQKDHIVRVYVQCPNVDACSDFVNQLQSGYNTIINKEEKAVYLDVDDSGKLRNEFKYLLQSEFSKKLQPIIFKLYKETENAISKI